VMVYVPEDLGEKRELGIIDNYIGYAKVLLLQGVESFYALGWGDSVSFAHKIANAIKGQLDSLKEIHRITYKSAFSDGGSVNALCILFRNKSVAELQDYNQSTIL